MSLTPYGMTEQSKPAHDTQRAQGTPGWPSAILRDVHFWVPVAVLLAGLLILRWIQ